MYIRFYLENHRMPNVSEKSSICRKLYATVQALAPKTDYEEFCRIVDKREAGYENHAVENNTCQDDTFFYIAGFRRDAIRVRKIFEV